MPALRPEQQVRAAAAASGDGAPRPAWTDDELSLLVKAANKFPGGVPDRWQRMAEFINHFASPSHGRSADEVTTKVKERRKELEVKKAHAAAERDKQEGRVPVAAAPATPKAAAASAAPKAAAAAPAVTSQVQLPAVRAKKRRRNFGGATLSAEEVEAFMQEGLEARPLVLNLASTPQVACGGWVFKEAGKNIRPADPRADKWRRGGGAGAATDLPNS